MIGQSLAQAIAESLVLSLKLNKMLFMYIFYFRCRMTVSSDQIDSLIGIND